MVIKLCLHLHLVSPLSTLQSRKGPASRNFRSQPLAESSELCFLSQWLHGPWIEVALGTASGSPCGPYHDVCTNSKWKHVYTQQPTNDKFWHAWDAQNQCLFVSERSRHCRRTHWTTERTLVEEGREVLLCHAESCDKAFHIGWSKKTDKTNPP